MKEAQTEDKAEQNQENRVTSMITLGDLLQRLTKEERANKRKKLFAEVLTLLGFGLLIYVVFAPQLYLRALAVGCFIVVSLLFDACGME